MTSIEKFTIEDIGDNTMIGGYNETDIYDIPKDQPMKGGSNKVLDENEDEDEDEDEDFELENFNPNQNQNQNQNQEDPNMSKSIEKVLEQISRDNQKKRISRSSEQNLIGNIDLEEEEEEEEEDDTILSSGRNNNGNDRNNNGNGRNNNGNGRNNNGNGNGNGNGNDNGNDNGNGRNNNGNGRNNDNGNDIVDPEELSSNNSVDPEELSSNNSVDPEGEIDELSSNNSVDPEGLLKQSNNIGELETIDPMLELPEEEFIIDDEDFIIQETKGDFKIFEEEVIPEEKVISNEKDQSEDLLNEIVRMLPEKLRSNNNELKKITKKIENYKKLKDTYSIKDETDIFKLIPKLKGNHYVKQIESILKGDFNNKYIVPIVNTVNNLYSIKSDDSLLFDANLDEIANNNFSKIDNEEHILKFINTRENYRKGKGRINYSYKSEINTYDKLMNINGNKSNYLNLKPKNDTFVFRNCFTEDCYYYNKNKLNTSMFDKHLSESDYYTNSNRDGPLTNGEKLDINGFIRLPKNYLKIKKLNIDKLQNILKQSYNYNDLYSNITNYSLENINFNIEKDKRVKLCFNIENDSTNIEGIITDINESTIFIKPINLEDDKSPPEILEIDKKDKDVKILNIENGSRNCLVEDENIFKIFIFDNEEIVNKQILTKYLKNIIPNTNEIIQKYMKEFIGSNDKTLDKVLEGLNYYDVSLEDFTFENLKELINVLYNHNQELSAQADEDEKQFSTFLKNIPREIRKNISFINNKSLNELKSYYGDYPYFNQSIDNHLTRLQWILSQPDNGQLYFKKIVKNITEKMNYDPAKMISNSESKLFKLKQELETLEEQIRKEKYIMVNDRNECLKFRIVKTYKSLGDLESHNEHDIEIDSDKVIYGEGTNLVQEGQYALLEEDPNNLKLYKRVKLASGADIWTLDKMGNLDFILNTNKDFCEQQLKNLEEIEGAMFNAQSCKFSDIDNNCIPAELDKKIQQKENLKQKIVTLDESIQEIRQTEDFTDNIDEKIRIIENYLSLVNDLEYRKFKNFERNEREEEEEEIDPKYEGLYQKIDLYMEKISKFSDNKKYLLLDPLLEKYGRDYNPANIVKENPNNIYCKYGNKVICCKHDKSIISMFKIPEKYQEIMENVIEEYGIENEGINWCKNCGREIYMADYETMEGFKKSGARDVTSELLETDDEYKSKYENVELVESLKKYLDEDDKQESVLGIINILNAFLSITGIKLNDKDEVKIVTETGNLCKTNIKNKIDWLISYTGKPKKADKNYENYREINTIFYTISLLFIVLQISIPEYIITKPHGRCVSTLDGYPLNDNNKNGIKYFACILDNLRETSSNWSCLKKIKLEDVLDNTITKLVNDDFIQSKYKEKSEYILKQRNLNLIKKRKNVWNEFKPALEPFEIENKTFDKLLSQNLDKKNNKEDLNAYYSLKIISKIDSIINDNPIQNNVFSPILLGNSCCIDTIGPNYNYLNFFSEDKGINKLLEQSHDLDNDLYENNKTQILSNTYIYENLQSFRRQVYPEEDDIEQKDISKLYETFVSNIGNKFLGKKHIYDNNVCLLTGEKRSAITQKVYKNEDYFDLLRTISNTKLMKIEFIDNQLDVLNNIDENIKNNEILKEDTYLAQFFTMLVETKDKVKIDQLWGDFKQQIKVEIDDIKEIIEGGIGKSKSKNIIEILNDLGLLNEIYKENIEINEFNAKKELFETRNVLIKKYMNYLFVLLSKIKNDSYAEIVDIQELPKNWKIQTSYFDNLMLLLQKDNEIIDKYIIQKRNSETQLLFNNIIRNIHIIKPIFDISGEEHILNCDMSIKRYSKMTNENCGLFLQYIFLITLRNILNVDMIFMESGSDAKVKVKTNTFDESADIEGISKGISSKSKSSKSSKSSSKSNNDDIIGSDQIIEEDLVSEQQKYDANQDRSRDQIMVINIIVDVLMEIKNNQSFYDKHTGKYMNKIIDKKMDSEKEENLKFIEELDKESRQSIKSMITIGVETWKNLSKKDDKNLYFGENINEEVAEEDENLIGINYNEEEIEELNRQSALQELGENYTDEQYQEFIEKRDGVRKDDMLAHSEMDVMRDDDGDGDVGAEDEEEF